MTNYNGPIRHITRDCDPFAREWDRIMDQLDHDRFEPQPKRWTDPAPVEPQEIEETVEPNLNIKKIMGQIRPDRGDQKSLNERVIRKGIKLSKRVGHIL